MTTMAAWSMLWHLTSHYILHGSSCQNGFYFSNRIAIPDYEVTIGPYPQHIAAQFYSYVLPEIAQFQNQEVQHRNIICTTLIPHEGLTYEILPENIVGYQGNESLPSVCAAVLSCRTGYSGKSNRGRLYIAGVPEDHAGQSELNADSFAQLGVVGNQLLSIFGPTGSIGYAQHVVFSKKLGYQDGQYLTTGIRPITSYVPRRVIGTQRHRLKGKGN